MRMTNSLLWLLSVCGALVAGCGGEAARSEERVTQGEWECSPSAVLIDLQNLCWKADGVLDQVCSRELDVDHPSSERVETCVKDPSGEIHVVAYGDNAELELPEGWTTIEVLEGGYAMGELDTIEFAHCMQYLTRGELNVECAEGP